MAYNNIGSSCNFCYGWKLMDLGDSSYGITFSTLLTSLRLIIKNFP